MGRTLAGWGTSRQGKARAGLGVAQRYGRFPVSDGDVVAPTAVGNILLAVQTHPSAAYNIDAALVWPRLQPLLPQEFAALLAAARARLDASVAVVASSAAMTVAGAVAAGLFLAPAAVFAYVPGGLLVTWLALRGVPGSAAAYADLVRAAFDLYRGALLARRDRDAGSRVPGSARGPRAIVDGQRPPAVLPRLAGGSPSRNYATTTWPQRSCCS